MNRIFKLEVCATIHKTNIFSRFVTYHAKLVYLFIKPNLISASEFLNFHYNYIVQFNANCIENHFRF